MKKIALLGVLTVGVFFGARALWSDSETIEVAPAIPAVTTTAITPLPFQETVSFSGFVRGAEHTDIAPKISGYVIKMEKVEGARVLAGERVAILDSGEVSAQEQSALSSLHSLTTTLAATKKYYRQRIDEAESALNNASGESAKDSAREAVETVKRLRDVEIAALETQLSDREGTVLISQSGVSNTVIRAPFTGILTSKEVSVGSFVTPGTPLYVLHSPETLEVSVSLPGSLAQSITKGSRVTLTNKSSSTEGVVFSIGMATQESTQRLMARVRFVDRTATRQFHFGEIVQVTFGMGAPSETLFVPEKAIVNIYDEHFVFTVQDGVARRQRVSVGDASLDKRAILSGLTAGARVVTEGVHALTDNQPVLEHYVTPE